MLCSQRVYFNIPPPQKKYIIKVCLLFFYRLLFHLTLSNTLPPYRLTILYFLLPAFHLSPLSSILVPICPTLRKVSSDPFSMYSVMIITGLPEKQNMRMFFTTKTAIL